MNKQIQFRLIHVLNKDGIGGAESLVKTLCNSDQNSNNKISHEILFIADSKFSTILFEKRLLKFIPIVFTVVRIIKSLSIHRILKRKYKLIYIFHLAESHVVAQILSTFKIYFQSSEFFIYLHQSKFLFPKKLTSLTQSLMTRFPVICYSKSATDSWYEDFKPKYKERTIIHNVVDNRFLTMDLNQLNTSINKCRLLFVGRFVEWKRPDLALEFAIRLSKVHPVEITFVGVSKDKFLSKYNFNIVNDDKLKVNFKGNQSNVSVFLKNTDLLINLCDTRLSGESLGINCLEALCSGVPVVVANDSKSDYSQKPGIYKIKDFFESQENYCDLKQDSILYRLVNGEARLSSQEKSYWREEMNVNRYNSDMISVLEKVFVPMRL
jgi:glycosyltransferase involved in cell wall biosynthesis